MILLLIQYGPTAAGLLIAVGVSVAMRRSRVILPMGTLVATSVGVLIAIGGMILYTAGRIPPEWILTLGEDKYLIFQLARFLVPLILTVIALVLLILPAPSAGPRGSAALAPRTLTTFAPKRWAGLWVAVASAVAVFTVLAGLASSPDDAGRYTKFTVEVSPTVSSATSIYGWWFSVPCVITIVILAAVTWVALVVISRPALAADPHTDTLVRTTRVRNVLAVGAGGLFLHLGAILQSLWGTSSLRSQLETGQAGTVGVGTSFAAMGPALQVASIIAMLIGMTLWWLVLLSALPVQVGRNLKSVSA